MGRLAVQYSETRQRRPPRGVRLLLVRITVTVVWASIVFLVLLGALMAGFKLR